MRRILAIFLVLASASLFVAPSAATAASVMAIGPVCICYHDGSHCDAINPDTSTTTDALCRSYCNTQYVDTYVNYAWDADNQSFNADTLLRACSTSEADAKTSDAMAASSTTTPTVGYAIPTLSVAIPGVNFTAPTLKSGNLTSNFLDAYITGLYMYLIGFAMIIAITMMMVGGLQYVLGASTGDVKSGKKRITDAVEGFVLLMFVGIILLTVNPNLVLLQSLEFKSVDQIKLDIATSGLEGASNSCGGISSYKNMPEPYKSIIASAKAGETCPLTGTDPYDSPTGKPPNCGSHHWDKVGSPPDYREMKNLDYAAVWGTEFHAPFAGTVSYAKGTGGKCGNTITLKGENGVSIYLCHAKDFTDANGAQNPTTAAKGQVLGHIGGKCCAGEVTSADWSEADKCTFTGPACTDPNKKETCDCQPIVQSGNTSGPHVHMTWSGAGNILACLDD